MSGSGFVKFTLLNEATLHVRPESVVAVYVTHSESNQWVTVVKIGDSEDGTFWVKETAKRVLEILNLTRRGGNK